MKLEKREILKIGLLMFSLFFGAGNLMFPPILGKEAGSNLIFAMLYFSITAIIFPILAVMVVSRFGGLRYMGNKVDKYFGMIFTIITALAIGPALAVPRAGILPYEIGIAPYVENSKFVLFGYTTIFFFIVAWFCLTPSKLLDRISKFLSPLFLFLIVLLFFGSLFKGMVNYTAPVEKYVPMKGVQGFLDGYMTLDILAGLMYGLVITYVIKDKGVAEEEVEGVVKKTGILAGLFLFIVYLIIAHLGGVSAVVFPETKNGLDILRTMSLHIYGKLGFGILVSLFFIACLNISVGVITSMSQYFTQLFPKTKYNYWVVAWVFLSYVISNKGLDEIMRISVPVLLAIYPVAVVLIIVAMLDKFINKYKFIYPITVYSTFFVSAVGILEKYGMKVPVFGSLFSKLPMYELDLGWITVAIIAMGISVIINKLLIKE